MKKTAAMLFLALLAVPAVAAQQSDTNVNYDQVRQDYRTYLKELKKLSEQYKQFTGEMKGILQEEGYPVWDENAAAPAVAAPGTWAGDGYRMKQEDDRITAELDLPGLKKDTLKVTLENDKLLRVSGRRKSDDTLVEKTLELPSPAVAKDTQARYEDGVLTVSLKKSEETKKEISVPVR